MYKIVISDHFKKQLKRLVRKNRTLVGLLKMALINFEKHQCISIGTGVYKMRLSGQSKGKSGGYRLYIYVMEVHGILTPVAIHAKNESESIGYGQLADHLGIVKGELEHLI